MSTTSVVGCVVAALGLAACSPFQRPLARTMANGEVLLPEADAVVARARAEGDWERAHLAGQADLVAATAADCTPALCAALARGEVALGMTEAQVLAATRTTAAAWEARRSGRVTLLSPPAGAVRAPSDARFPLALVTLRDGRVASYTYREPQGPRSVTGALEATPAGAASARAEALLQQGDDYAAAGRLDLALERYDEADVLRPRHPETTLRIAATLDKQLRPVEALLRYQLFVHQLELEKIRTRGDAAAKMAEAIARAQERIVVLEKR